MRNWSLLLEFDRSIQSCDADTTIVCYCTAGYRSGYCSKDLEARLQRPVLNLDGGIIAYANAGGRLVRRKTGTPLDSRTEEEEIDVNVVNPFSKKWGKYLADQSKIAYK